MEAKTGWIAIHRSGIFIYLPALISLAVLELE